MRGDGETFFGDGTSEFVGFFFMKGRQHIVLHCSENTRGGGSAVSVASFCVFALTRRSLRLGDLRKATMGVQEKYF